MSKLTIVRGLPASGKDTLARALVAESLPEPHNVWVVNRDALRFQAGLDSKPGPYETEITLQQHALVRAGLKKDRHVISSDMNLRAQYVKALAEIADFFGAEIEVIDMDTPLETCIERDRARGVAGGHTVGEDMIRAAHKRFFAHGKFPANPLINRPEPAKLVPYEPNTTLPPAYIFDIDGTVAKMNGRSPYDYTKVLTDLPHEDVLELAWMLYTKGYQIIFLSGRDGSCLVETVEWIKKYSLFRVGFNCALFMRNAGDRRADFVIKHELFYKYIAPYFWVRGVFDDRNQVVDMWRSINVRAYQVAPGDF